MTGMRTLIALRKSGLKPSCVVLCLVKAIDPLEAEAYAFSETTGNLDINIAENESLNDIDFRPLVGLMVMAFNNAENAERYRRLCSLVAKVNPSHMVMSVQTGEQWTVHQRWAGEPIRVESTAL